MVLATELLQRRVDLDGVHPPRAVGQRHRDVVAGAGADDEYVRRRRRPLVGKEVEGR
jgi:hypothetical protein